MLQFSFQSLALVNEDFNIPDEIQGERLVYFRTKKSFKGKSFVKIVNIQRYKSIMSRL